MDANTTILTVIGVALLAFVVVGMLISQSRHRALEAKNNQIRMLALQQRRLQNLIKTLPANYLSVELRDFLYQALIQNIQQHMALMKTGNELLNVELETTVKEREAARKNPPSATSELISPEKASVYRGLLKSVYQFIRRNYETGRLTKEDAEKMISQVEVKMAETAIDFFLLTAREAKRNGHFRQARNAYQKSLDAIEDSAHAAQFKQEGFKIRSELNQLIDQWRDTREQKNTTASEKLAGEMETMVGDQESWKKKHDYE